MPARKIVSFAARAGVSHALMASFIGGPFQRRTTKPNTGQPCIRKVTKDLSAAPPKSVSAFLAGRSCHAEGDQLLSTISAPEAFLVIDSIAFFAEALLV
jgi:hypothetical protein